jgi:hypothetical protein
MTPWTLFSLTFSDSAEAAAGSPAKQHVVLSVRRFQLFSGSLLTIVTASASLILGMKALAKARYVRSQSENRRQRRGFSVGSFFFTNWEKV